jgi:O-methyltransferase involved in polyketide biosynthesis
LSEVRFGLLHSARGNRSVQIVSFSIHWLLFYRDRRAWPAPVVGEYNPRSEDTANYVALRTRFFDNVAQGDGTLGIRQIVLPAAGMDAEMR